MEKGNIIFRTNYDGSVDVREALIITKIYSDPTRNTVCNARPIYGGKSTGFHANEFVSISRGLKYKLWAGYEWWDVEYPKNGLNKDQIVDGFQRGVCKFTDLKISPEVKRQP